MSELKTTRNSDASPTRGFRYSLRSMLIALVALGVYCGVMGRLFVRAPEVFQAVWSISTTVVPFLLAIATLIYFTAKAEKRLGWVIWTTLLAVTPIVGILSLPLFPYLRSVLVPAPTMAAQGELSPSELRSLTTTQLIEDQLPNRFADPWVWQALEQRVGSLTDVEADEITVLFTEHMNSTQPKGWDSPLHWCGNLFEQMIDTDSISPDVLSDMLDAYHGPASAYVDRTRESSKKFSFDVTKGHSWSNHHRFFPNLLWEIVEVSVAGQAVEYRQDSKHGNRMTGTSQQSFAKGAHELKVVIDCAYVDAKKMVGLDIYNLKREDWPKPAKAWQETVVLPFQVYGDDETLVALVTDPSKSPEDAFEPKLAVQKQGERKKVILEMATDGITSVDVCFSIKAVFGETEIPLGSFKRAKSKGRVITSSSGMTSVAKTLPPNRFADIVLTPNPAGVERDSEVEEIWGQEIVLERVPVERFDLETE